LFASLDFLGASFTEAWRINPRGDIVGHTTVPALHFLCCSSPIQERHPGSDGCYRPGRV